MARGNYAATAGAQYIHGPAPYLLSAMIQQRQGQLQGAGKSLDIAVTLFDWNPNKATNREAWMYHILRREAEKMIRPGGEPVIEAN